MEDFRYLYSRNQQASREQFNCVISLFDSTTGEANAGFTEIVHFCLYVMREPVVDLYKEARKLISIFNKQLRSPAHSRLLTLCNIGVVDDISTVSELNTRMKVERQQQFRRTNVRRKERSEAKKTIVAASASASSSSAAKGKRKAPPPTSDEEVKEEEGEDAEMLELWDNFTATVVEDFLKAVDVPLITQYAKSKRTQEKLTAFAELLQSIAKAAYMMTENYKEFAVPVMGLFSTFKILSAPSTNRLPPAPLEPSLNESGAEELE